MNDDSRGQVTGSAAEVYEAFFVPAIFQQWAPRLAQAAQLAPGHKVLDVACGTGVLAREATRHVAPGGSVTGLDRNEGMLAVARSKAPDVDWREGVAEALPFVDHAFDAVASQFGLMFFDDRTAALREMWRVLRPGGRLVVAVWGALDRSPGYADMVSLLERLFGARTAGELRAPFRLGDEGVLADMALGAGIPHADVTAHAGTARFPSLEAWMETDVKGWTLADVIDDAQFAALVREARQALAHHVQADGTVAFPNPALFLSAAKT